MKRMAIAAVAFAGLLANAGCASERYAYRDTTQNIAQDTLYMMTKADVIALSNAGVSDDVIIDEIKATGSFFQLSTQDIVDLAKANVTDKVIQVMVNTSRPSTSVDGRDWNYYYPPYYAYFGYPFFSPWYPSFYFGVSWAFHRPFYHHRFVFPRYRHVGHAGLGGGHGSYGGRGDGGARSGGRHR